MNVNSKKKNLIPPKVRQIIAAKDSCSANNRKKSKKFALSPLNFFRRAPLPASTAV
jgi:hypothetical protein